MPRPPRRRWFQFPDSGADSLDLVELVMEVEEKLGPIPERDQSRIRSPDDLRRYCEDRLGRSPPAGPAPQS